MFKPVMICLILCIANANLLAQTIEHRESQVEINELDVSKLKNPDQVRVAVWLNDANPDAPPLAGKTTIKDSSILFEPRFPLLPGEYRVEVQTEPNAAKIKLILNINPEEEAVTEVESVYPSADTIPENTLKFYVHFSAPMRKGEIYKFVKLREQGGKDVDVPFLEIEQEFWSRDSKRLTLLLDPGRIKRGLKPREEMGPILVDGKTYELVISGEWPDANGSKLGAGEDFVKAFKAAEEDQVQPNVENWKVESPKMGTKDPLVVRLPESLDHALLQRSLQVLQAGKEQPLAGEVKVSKHETVWSFSPQEPWGAGEYRLEVAATLEDLCGNSIGRKFEVDMFQKTEPSNSDKNAVLIFKIGK